MKKTRPNPIQQAIEKTKQAERARAAGREAEALALEAELAQLSWRAATKTKVPYDVFLMHAHFAKFDSVDSLLEQVRRGEHADTSGKNVTVSRAGKAKTLIEEGLDAGKTVTAIAYEVASFFSGAEQRRFLAVRNGTAKLTNELRLRALIAEAGSLENAKELAGARKVQWAPICAVPENEEGDKQSAHDELAHEEADAETAEDDKTLGGTFSEVLS